MKYIRLVPMAAWVLYTALAVLGLLYSVTMLYRGGLLALPGVGLVLGALAVLFGIAVAVDRVVTIVCAATENH